MRGEVVTVEIQAGRELDALVAERVMGARRTVDEYGRASWATREALGLIGPHTPLPQWLVPAYSTDIAAAWQVVERMREQGYGVTVWARVPAITNKPPFAASIVRHAHESWPIQDADTAPLAICRAALAAIGHTP